MFTKHLPGAIAAGVLMLGLAACGGSATASTSPSTSAPASASAPASSAPASSSAAASASSSASASAAPAASGGAIVGQKAPGPYTPNGTASTSGGQASIQGLDTLKWQPNTLTVTAGEKVTLQIKNAGSADHNFTSPSLGVSPTDVGPGKTVTLNFNAPSQAGTYQFWCSVPGHAEAGMVGEVIVK